MNEVYGQARQVLVYLGGAKQDSDLAMTSVARIATALSRIGQKIDPNTLEELGLEPQNHALWRSVGYLLRRP